MPTIAFEGRHCSGQRDIGKIVARKLGFDYIDRIILADIAKKVGSTVEAVSKRQDKKPSIAAIFANGITQILNNSSAIGMGGDPYFGPGIETVMSKEYNELDETIVKNPEDIDYNRMIKATKEVIYDISQLGKVLIISRGASAILKDQDNTLRIFFISNFERRIEIAKDIHNVTSNDEAEEILKHADHAQNEYYIKAFGLDFDDMSMYHSVLNTSALEVETCSEVVLALAKSNLRI
ncbi:MAG: hypothetical protein CL899_02570 [Dehalococcoidia bacterium]|nr:hypothetical protein [Dehalococcoidia bacterium]